MPVRLRLRVPDYHFDKSHNNQNSLFLLNIMHLDCIRIDHDTSLTYRQIDGIYIGTFDSDMLPVFSKIIIKANMEALFFAR